MALLDGVFILSASQFLLLQYAVFDHCGPGPVLGLALGPGNGVLNKTDKIPILMVALQTITQIEPSYARGAREGTPDARRTQPPRQLVGVPSSEEQESVCLHLYFFSIIVVCAVCFPEC